MRPPRAVRRSLMSTLPAPTIRLFDRTHESFGVIRLVLTKPDFGKGECIFDVQLGEAPQSERSEVRWLCKRHYRQASEHRFKLGKDGSLTISSGDFQLKLVPDPEEGGLTTTGGAPPVRGVWE